MSRLKYKSEISDPPFHPQNRKYNFKLVIPLRLESEFLFALFASYLGPLATDFKIDLDLVTPFSDPHPYLFESQSPPGLGS